MVNSTDFGFEFLASKLKLLKKIDFNSCSVSDASLIALSLNCVLLKDITIVGYNELTETGVAHLLRNRPNLEALSIGRVENEYPESTNAIVTIENSISHAKSLTSLVLGGISNTDKVLMAIAKAKLRLNSLGLVSCNGLTVSGLLLVLSNHLTKLCIQKARITDEDVEALVLKGDVGKLTHIEISKCPVTESTLFLLAANCPSLIDIKISKMKFCDHGWIVNVPLSENLKTRSLCLAECDLRINNESVKRVGLIFPNLKVLDLNDCWDVTTTGIEAILECCKHIKELSLRGFQGEKLFEASNVSNLPKLEVLELSSSRVNDEGLAAITKKCHRLLSLKLSCTDITTEGIKLVVQNIKTLTSLMIYYNEYVNYGDLLDWMLLTGNLASLNKIFLLNKEFSEEQRDKFLDHGCLLLPEYWC